MKRLILVMVTLAFFAIPLAAEEDSPLVAAAKRTNRAKKKTTIVINDETLKAMSKDAGHVTTTKIVYAPPPLLPTAKTVPGATIYKPEPKKKAEAPKPQRPRGDDAEGYLEEDEAPPPTSTAPAETPKAASTPQAKKP